MDSSPEYTLRPEDVWNDYEPELPEDQLSGFFSTYWCDFDEISLPDDSLTAEFIRYTVPNAQHRPSVLYSGVARPTSAANTSTVTDAFAQIVELAKKSQEEPVISYSQGDITSVESIWTDGDKTECIAVIEAGCAGYFDDTLTLIEQRGEFLIRTSVKPGSESNQMKEMFAHGFQTVVRNRLDNL